MPMLSQVIPYWEMRADGRAQIGMEGGVTAFMSTITSKIDAKGRVSVPSVFRSAIAAQNGDVASPTVFSFIPPLPKMRLRVAASL